MENKLPFAVLGDLSPDLALGLAEALVKTHAKIAAIQAGRCPDCQQPMTLAKRGAGVYALPCHHLLYHGDVPPQLPADQRV